MAAPVPSVSPSLRFNGAWNTVPVLAYERPTVIERGYTDEGTIRPGKISLRIDDRAAPTLNPSRPASLLYGVTGRGMGVGMSVDGSLRAWMESAVLDPDQTPDFAESPARGKRWLDLEAYGPLYRIGQWSDEIQPPMTRTFLQYPSLIGFWPGDDEALSTRVGLSRSYSGVTLADDDAPPGAAGSFVGSATTAVIMGPTHASTSAGWQVFFSTKITNVPAAPNPLPFFTWRANGLLWNLEADTAGVTLRMFSGGVQIDSISFGLNPGELTQWMAWRAKTYQSGGNVVTELAFYTTQYGVAGITRSVPATLDRLTSIRINGNAIVNGARYGQIGALTGTSDDLQSAAAIASFEGYRGETTAARFLRLLAEAGISRTVQGTTTTKMGPQKSARLMDLLKEIAATEDGLIFDKKDAIQVVLRTRRHRQNQAAVMTLNALTDIVPPFRERIDNVGVQNYVTITDRGGAVITVSKTSGPMSTAPYPAGIGVFKGGPFPDVDVNLADPTTDLPSMAAWYLARGTAPGPRFPSLTLEVGMRSPGLRAAVKALEIGDRILVTGRLPDAIDLHVIGITEEVGTHTWRFTLTLIPGEIFDVGAEDSMAHRLDSLTTTLQDPKTTTDNFFVFTFTRRDDAWSTTSLPYDINVGGERMTVTAMNGVTGTGPWQQTCTVTRSVNGVVKAHPAGAPVRIFTPYREAW